MVKTITATRTVNGKTVTRTFNANTWALLNGHTNGWEQKKTAPEPAETKAKPKTDK